MSAFRQQDRSAGRRQGGAGQGQVDAVVAFGQDRAVGMAAAGKGPAFRRQGSGVTVVRAVQVCVRWMQRPVSASWNIIQYPLPSGAKRETGTYELYFFNGSGGLWRRSAGTP